MRAIQLFIFYTFYCFKLILHYVVFLYVTPGLPDSRFEMSESYRIRFVNSKCTYSPEKLLLFFFSFLTKSESARITTRITRDLALALGLRSSDSRPRIHSRGLYPRKRDTCSASARKHVSRNTPTRGKQRRARCRVPIRVVVCISRIACENLPRYLNARQSAIRAERCSRGSEDVRINKINKFRESRVVFEPRRLRARLTRKL